MHQAVNCAIWQEAPSHYCGSLPLEAGAETSCTFCSSNWQSSPLESPALGRIKTERAADKQSLECSDQYKGKKAFRWKNSEAGQI